MKIQTYGVSTCRQKKINQGGNVKESFISWTEENQMKLNEEKANYMIFSRSQLEFATRLSVNGKILDRVENAKVVDGLANHMVGPGKEHF